MRYILYIAISITLLAAPALADWPQGGIPVSESAEAQVGHIVVPDGQGGAVYVWVENTAPPSIRAQRIDRYGNSDIWPAGGVTVTPAGSNPGLPSAVADGLGGVLVAWQEKSVTPFQVRAQWVANDGQLTWDAGGVSVSNSLEPEQSNPLMVRGINSAYVVYNQLSVGGAFDVWAQSFDASGARLWDTCGAVVCTSSVYDSKNPVALARGDSSIMVAWEDNRNANWDIFANTVVFGLPNTPTGLAVCDIGGTQNKPCIARDDSGGAVIAWQDYRNGNSDVYAQRYKSGMMQWAPYGGVPVCTLAGDQTEIDISMMASGRTLLCWTDLRNGAGNDDIYGMVLNGNGSQQWPDADGKMICNAAHEQQAPKVLVNAINGSDFIITWQDYRNNLDWDVYALKSNLAWDQVWEAFVCQEAGSNSRFPRVSWGSNQYVYFVWTDNRNGPTNLFAQRAVWAQEYIGGVLAPELIVPEDMGVVGTDTVNFAWHPTSYPPGATLNYRIQVDNDPDFLSPEHNQPTSDTTTSALLSPGQWYWRVRAYNVNPPDTSNWAGPWTFTIDTSVPSVPSLIAPPNASHTCSTWVNFEWQDVSAAMYHIQIALNGQWSTCVVDDSTMGMSPYGYDFTWDPNGKYLWRVRAGSAAHVWSNWSQVWSVTVDTVKPMVLATNPPNSAANVSTQTNIVVTFNEPVRSDASLQFSCNPDPGGWNVQQVDNDIVFLRSTPLNYNTSYAFTVTSYTDSAGNTGSPYGFQFATEPLVDTTKPRLTVLANAQTMDLGQDFTFECYAKDEHRLNQVRLIYGPAGGGTNNDVAMTLASGTDSLWQYVIPANQVSTRGVQYRVLAEDSVLAGGVSNFTYYPANQNDFYVHAVQFPGGAYTTTFPSDQWHMLSVPGDYSNISMFDMLADDLGPYDKTKWRLFHIQDQTPVEQETGGSGLVSRGRALWLRQRIGNDIFLDFQGVQKSRGDRLRSQPDSISLPPGWSDIGNSLAFDVRWDTTLALSDTASVAGPYHYNGTAWVLPNQVVQNAFFSPYQGYSFRNNRATAARLMVPFIAAWKEGKDGTEPLWPEGWQAKVTVRSGESYDEAFLGIGAGTSEGVDRWDFPEPPYGLVPAAGYFILGDEKCAVDLRPELGEGQAWDYAVAATGPVSLEIGLPADLPPDAKVWLLDLVRQSSFELCDGFTYGYAPEPGESERRFKLVAGNEVFVRSVLAGAFGTPSATLMERSRPNPFSQTTTINYQLATGGPVKITVYNVAGQRVRTLVERNQMAGRYVVRWDGRDDRGQRVSNGVYFCRMQAGTVSSSQRMTLVR